MPTLYKRLILMLLPLLCGVAQGQHVRRGADSCHVQGVVRDAATREPLPYATVTVVDAQWKACALTDPLATDSLRRAAATALVCGTVADAEGRYRLSWPAQQGVYLCFSYAGYRGADTVVPRGHSRLLVIDAQLHQAMLATHEVTAQRRVPVDFTHIDKISTQHMTGPNESVESLLKTLPDVVSNNELSSHFSVRGGSFDENLVYINGVEIYRPMLVRSGQQEGMSIINPDLVSDIQFSPGGFSAVYGDRMSSVLDITYNRHIPKRIGGSASLSMLGANLSLLGSGPRWDYALGIRRHSNRYILGSLDTKGDYATHYTDMQALLNYHFNDKWHLHLLTILSRNVYDFLPASQTTVFGSFMENLELDIYFDGKEQDRYRTLLAATTLEYVPNEDWSLRWTPSFQHNKESELYDIQSQYWLSELNVGAADTADGRVDRGIGTYLEHARNYLTTNIWATEWRATRYAALGDWQWGLKLQHEEVEGRSREWKWVDSAGYTLPFAQQTPGDSTAMPQVPVLQNFSVSANRLAHNRATAYLYRDFNFLTSRDDRITVAVGARGQLYGLWADTTQQGAGVDYVVSHTLFSPRLSVALRPHGNSNMLWRWAAGVYSQPPFYREYRHDDGSLNLSLLPQHSYQTMATLVYDLTWWHRPFQLTADVYYKYITNLIAYRVDNLRLRYDADNDAVAYATGISVRLAGEFVPGIQSWASLSLMKTQEDLLNDDQGWLDRPTDQRISFKIFFQDYVPRLPFWQMSMSFVVGSGLPANDLNPFRRSHIIRLAPYYRVDWGNTIQLNQLPRLKEWALFRYISDLWLTVDVFNLFNYKNEASFIWVADYNNYYYPVPNNLTGRQISLKLTATF